MPSIISYEQITPEKWSEHFCLVNPVQCFDSGDKASALAEADLNDASAAKSDSGSDEDFAMSLKNKGYMKVDNFRRAVN
jgi:hypothetical protein